MSCRASPAFVDRHASAGTTDSVSAADRTGTSLSTACQVRTICSAVNHQSPLTATRPVANTPSRLVQPTPVMVLISDAAMPTAHSMRPMMMSCPDISS